MGKSNASQYANFGSLPYISCKEMYLYQALKKFGIK